MQCHDCGNPITDIDYAVLFHSEDDLRAVSVCYGCDEKQPERAFAHEEQQA